MAAASVSQALSNSLNKGEKMDAFNQILGDAAILLPWYSTGRSLCQIKPHNLTLFQLLLLANVVHEISPQYSNVEKNCYWYANVIVDAVISMFGVHNDDPKADDDPASYDATRKRRFKPDPNISGRWHGWKVNHTKEGELVTIYSEFKTEYRDNLSKVRTIFFTISKSLVFTYVLNRLLKVLKIGKSFNARKLPDHKTPQLCGVRPLTTCDGEGTT